MSPFADLIPATGYTAQATADVVSTVGITALVLLAALALAMFLASYGGRG